MDGEKNVFAALSAINVNDKTEKKNGLTYLSWAWAWGEVKKRYPEAAYTIYENREGWCYHTDGRTCWVKTGVTIGGQECIEYLPVMDHRNRSIPLESVTSFDVNKAIQRSLTKAIARHGLGLYIYAGEDLPEGEEKPAEEMSAETFNAVVNGEKFSCADCGREVTDSFIADGTLKAYGRVLCRECGLKEKRKRKDKDLEHEAQMEMIDARRDW